MAPRRIGFFSNQLDNRGTGNALFNYAHYNELILNNKSVIITRYDGRHDTEAKERFRARFGEPLLIPGHELTGVDAVYHIKSGAIDGVQTHGIPYLVHAVFESQPHGDVYATVSPWMGQRFNLPVVPHIVETPQWIISNLREGLEIPQEAVVFGSYGGSDSFDITFVKDYIISYLQENPSVYFIFMNTEPFANHPQIIFLPGTVDAGKKQQFINTCDAMIHARSRGETFGIAVGEFAINGKPVITYSESHERAHLQELGHFALLYNDVGSLKLQFDKVKAGPLIGWGYGQYTPENVMKKFEEVFLHAVN